MIWNLQTMKKLYSLLRSNCSTVVVHWAADQWVEQAVLCLVWGSNKNCIIYTGCPPAQYKIVLWPPVCNFQSLGQNFCEFRVSYKRKCESVQIVSSPESSMSMLSSLLCLIMIHWVNNKSYYQTVIKHGYFRHLFRHVVTIQHICH